MSRVFGISSIRSLSRTSVLYQQNLVKLKKIQADYQCEDGRPIWLKGGLCDRMLYSATILGALGGVVWSVVTIYDMAKPDSWKTAC